jgi:hypothetical protein
MSEIDKIQIGISGIDQLIETAKSDLVSLQDCSRQLTEIATIVDNFVLQTLQLVSDNEDVTAVNETLANSLIQIKNFIDARPQNYQSTIQGIVDRLSAYEQCKIVLVEVASIEEAQEPDETISDDKEAETISDATRDRILEGMDEDGNYAVRRKFGDRPEKLRDIRTVEKELETSNISQEDN